MEPLPPAVEAWSLNHWTAREVPGWFLKLQDEKKKTKNKSFRMDLQPISSTACGLNLRAYPQPD